MIITGCELNRHVPKEVEGYIVFIVCVSMVYKVQRIGKMGVVYGILGLQNYTEDLSVSFLVVEQHKLTTYLFGTKAGN